MSESELEKFESMSESELDERKLKALGFLLKTERRRKKLTQKELAQMTKMSQGYISDLENGEIKNPTYKALFIIATSLGFTNDLIVKLATNIKIQTIYAIDDKNESDETNETNDTISRIPIFTFDTFNKFSLALRNIIGYEYQSIDKESEGEYFGLRVNGDIMNLSHILDGQIVIVKEQDTLENGEIMVVSIYGEYEKVNMISRIYATNTLVTLIPHSSNLVHQPRVIDISKTEIKIWGKVIKIIINL